MDLVRRQVVEDLLAFYCEHNALYEDVVVNCSGLAAETVAENLISEETSVNVDVNDVDGESDRVGSATEIGETVGETDVVEHSVVFIAEDREHNLSFLFDTRVDLLARRTCCSRACSRTSFRMVEGIPMSSGRFQYIQLSTRRFVEDELFTLVSFDHLTLQRMYLHVALKCQRDPTRFERYSAISEGSLLEALQNKKLHRQGRATVTHDDSSTDSDFLKTVELSTGVIWGSDAEQEQCRRRAFAYQARYVQPALFVTLTPNVGDSFVMAHYAGISSVDTLFDANLAQLPRRSALQKASLRNDVASARLFMHNMNAFIEHVLGIPPTKMKTKAFDGLFRDVKAYFGVVETQGGGTLHAHFLVWLTDAPPSTDAFSITTAEHTTFCGHSLEGLLALSIPREAYENPNAGRSNAQGEPLFVRCPQCATKMSSQHVLRRIILQQRPPTWPPPLRTYSSEELKTAVQMEISCRGSVGAAKAAAFRRDMILATRDSVDDTYGEHLRTLNAVPYRSEQRGDNAFSDDKVAQSIMMLPPSVDDERWTPNATAFAVSMLVFMLNIHWWSHVGSCF
ncbi:hypothetical protein L914_19262 [Phytophthora nicotianae]|uniref:Helitron helicase-like domain-containing protein n=1 Tax=Phytophthora nicotianae TaxID=4792 RepID=W2MB12_PHYNI|nr:hypothetical protein L914_19262 [Phytophthora nicotianae]